MAGHPGRAVPSMPRPSELIDEPPPIGAEGERATAWRDWGHFFHYFLFQDGDWEILSYVEAWGCGMNS